MRVLPATKASYDPTKGYPHPIYILADHGCGSAGESTLALLRVNPQVKVIGENTYGAVHFGNQGKFFLPESKIQVGMGTHFVESRDGKFYEKVGYAPDVQTPKGKDAMKWVKTELAKH